MTVEIQCPFCGNTISEDAERCPNCSALFTEPKLPMFKFKELGLFFAIDFITLGFFSTIWFFINGKAINNIVVNKRDIIKINWLILLLIANGAFYLFYFYQHETFLIIFSLLQILIYVGLAYRTLRIIQRYTKQTYGVDLEINPYYIILFNVFYLVHFIDTYTNRVQGMHEYFDWRSAQGILLITLILIIIFISKFSLEIQRLILR